MIAVGRRFGASGRSSTKPATQRSRPPLQPSRDAAFMGGRAAPAGPRIAAGESPDGISQFAGRPCPIASLHCFCRSWGPWPPFHSFSAGVEAVKAVWAAESESLPQMAHSDSESRSEKRWLCSRTWFRWPAPSDELVFVVPGIRSRTTHVHRRSPRATLLSPEHLAHLKPSLSHSSIADGACSHGQGGGGEPGHRLEAAPT